MAGQESQECCVSISDLGIRGIYIYVSASWYCQIRTTISWFILFLLKGGGGGMMQGGGMMHAGGMGGMGGMPQGGSQLMAHLQRGNSMTGQQGMSYQQSRY